jgi:hypothetical protein
MSLHLPDGGDGLHCCVSWMQSHGASIRDESRSLLHIEASWENRVKGTTYTDKVSKMAYTDHFASKMFERMLCIVLLDQQQRSP